MVEFSQKISGTRVQPIPRIIFLGSAHQKIVIIQGQVVSEMFITLITVGPEGACEVPLSTGSVSLEQSYFAGTQAT